MAEESPVEGQRTLEGEPLDGLHLDDKIPPDAHTLFVGINPGIRSAEINHYYAGHTNYFWKLLHASGLWPSPLTTEDDDQILEAGFGLTDVAKRPTPGSSSLSKSDFMHAKTRMKNLARRFNPEVIAFVSKTAIRAYLGDMRYPVEYGLQDWRIEDSDVFSLPSTSGQSLGDTSYEEKLEFFVEFRDYLESEDIYSP